jgi:hypothetical protein
MLLQDPKHDTTFKEELTQYVDATRIDSRSLLDRIRKENLYSSLGTAFKSLAHDDFEKASAQAHRDQQVATGSDKTALYFLTSLLKLLSFATPSGTIVFQELPPNAKIYFVWALEHARELGNQNVSLKELVTAEIETICPGAPTIIRLGQYSDNRLGDFLLQGPDDFRVFAADHLDRLHSSGIRVYDSCYPALLEARNATHSTQLQRRITEVIKRIERDNPAATLPIIARNVISAIRAGADPLQHFRASTQLRGLSPEDLCILVLGVAEDLAESGQREASTKILSAAAQYAGANAKFKAWVGLALGDTVNAAYAMFEYGLSSLSGSEFIDRTERYHAVEIACRLFFRGYPAVGRGEYQIQVNRYQAAGYLQYADRIRTWQAALDEFDTYLTLRLKQAQAHIFDPNEVHISSRATAERHFLMGVNGNFQKYLKLGIQWFEKSAVDNDAPWIQGERLLLNAVFDSLQAFQAAKAKASASKIWRSIEERLVRAGDLLHSPYPLALSLAFRGLTQGSSGAQPSSIRDLTLSIEMLEPKTPEVLEVQRRIAEARWALIEALAAQKSLGIRRTRALWVQIARLVPLLSEVIDEDTRLRQHFSPARGLVRLRQGAVNLTELASVEDPHERGRLLEHVITDMVNASSGLRVVDVRHRNDYEEIDIIVSITQYNPLLSHWGPLLLIECKNWRNKVGTDPVRAFYTKMTTKKGAVRLGVIVSPSGFTKGVRELSRLFQDALVIAIGPEELRQVATRKESFLELLEQLIPDALFG